MADNEQSFRDWLIAQKDRHDPVGHLGEDFAADEEAINLMTVDEVRDHIHAESSYQPALGALDRAIAEYRLLEG